MKKKFSSIVLVFSMLCTFMPVIASAAESGSCGANGANVTWTLDDEGTLTISGTGDMQDYSSYSYSSAAPWYNSRSSITKAVIEQGVTSIGEDALRGCSALTSVTIPNSITKIGSSAFGDCSSLTSIIIPDSVTNIDVHAFVNCNNLQDVYITDIAKWCKIDFGGGMCNPLYYADNLYVNDVLITDLVIPTGVINIGDYTFDGCSCLTSIDIPNSVISIGDYAFSGCSDLTSVTIPNSIISIGKRAFHSCGSLTSVDIPDSVASIGESAFYGCSGLTSVTIGNGIISIDDSTFWGCKSLTDITIPTSLMSIGYCAFYGCSSLTDMTIPNGVTSIGANAFASCKSLMNIKIPNSVTSIGACAFGNCSSLKYIKIPYSVTDIDRSAFRTCGDLNISVVENNPNYSDIDGVLFNKNKTEIIAYAKDRLQSSYSIPQSVTHISSHAFDGCTSLTKITIPDNVTCIDDSAFWDCTSLTKVTIPDNVTSIGSYAFKSCSSLTDITIPDSVTSIGSEAFFNTGYYCDEANWKDDVLYIGNYLIDARKDISGAYKVKSGTRMIAKQAFFMCNSLTDITISDGVTDIGGNHAFYGCGSLTSITIPDSVTNIGDWAFEGCGSLTDVYYSGSEVEWKQIVIGGSNDELRNATIHYNSKVLIPLPVTTAEITKEETDTAYTFTVTPETAYENCFVYAAVYDANGTLIAFDRVPLEMTGSTSVSVDKQENGVTAKVFVWSDFMQSIIEHAEEFSLIE